MAEKFDDLVASVFSDDFEANLLKKQDSLENVFSFIKKNLDDFYQNPAILTKNLKTMTLNVVLEVKKISKSVEISAQFRAIIFLTSQIKSILGLKKFSIYMPYDIVYLKLFFEILDLKLVEKLDKESLMNLNTFYMVWLYQLFKTPFKFSSKMIESVFEILLSIERSNIFNNKEIGMLFGKFLTRPEILILDQATAQLNKMKKDIFDRDTKTASDSSTKLRYFLKFYSTNIPDHMISSIESNLVNFIDENETVVPSVLTPVLKSLASISFIKIKESQKNDIQIFNFLIRKISINLKTNNTNFRYQVAKIMAKVLAKLSNDSCESIINELISTCNENDYPLESLTHGVCLSIAFTLRRKRSLSKESINNVIEFVALNAINFDSHMGKIEVGSKVRDASAFILWTIFKYYPKIYFCENFKLIMPKVLIAALFDREKLVRFAFSSVLQEFIGRTNLLSSDLIQLINIECVSRLNNSIQKMDALFKIVPEFIPDFISSIMKIKINHWDRKVAKYSSQNLAKYFSNSPESEKYISNIVDTYQNDLIDTNKLQFMYYLKFFGHEMPSNFEKNIADLCMKSISRNISPQDFKIYIKTLDIICKTLKEDINIDLPAILDVVKYLTSQPKGKPEFFININRKYMSNITKYISRTSPRILNQVQDNIFTLINGKSDDLYHVSYSYFISFTKSGMNKLLNMKAEMLKHFYNKKVSVNLKTIILEIFFKFYNEDTDELYQIICHALKCYIVLKSRDEGLKLRVFCLKMMLEINPILDSLDEIKKVKVVGLITVQLFGNISILEIAAKCFYKYINFITNIDIQEIEVIFYKDVYHIGSESLKISELGSYALLGIIKAFSNSNYLESQNILNISKYNIFYNFKPDLGEFFLLLERIEPIENIYSKRLYSNVLNFLDSILDYLNSYLSQNFARELIKFLIFNSTLKTKEMESKILMKVAEIDNINRELYLNGLKMIDISQINPNHTELVRSFLKKYDITEKKEQDDLRINMETV